MPTGNLNPYKCAFLLNEKSVENICAFAREAGKTAPLSQKAWLHLDIALDEAVRNIMLHSGLTREHHISVECKMLPNGFSVILIDEGRPFNPVKAPQDTFGICLLNRLLEQLSYERLEMQNVLTLTKLNKTGAKN